MVSFVRVYLCQGFCFVRVTIVGVIILRGNFRHGFLMSGITFVSSHLFAKLSSSQVELRLALLSL